MQLTGAVSSSRSIPVISELMQCGHHICLINLSDKWHVQADQWVAKLVSLGGTKAASGVGGQ